MVSRSSYYSDPPTICHTCSRSLLVFADTCRHDDIAVPPAPPRRCSCPLLCGDRGCRCESLDARFIRTATRKE